MIFPQTFSGITPLHALALACTENLPASGLGNSLTVSNLPSGYTPRILLKLFQSRYPSAYRATIPPLAEAKKVVFSLLPSLLVSFLACFLGWLVVSFLKNWAMPAHCFLASIPPCLFCALCYTTNYTSTNRCFIFHTLNLMNFKIIIFFM